VGLCEVFLQVGKSGGCVASQSEAIGRLVSLALRSGIDPKAIIKQLKGIRCPAPSWHNGSSILSCADAIATAIERYVKEYRVGKEQVGKEQVDKGQVGEGAGRHADEEAPSQFIPDISPECPDCGSLLEFVEGCAVCRNCGYSQCL